jgi:hypothetical protein
MERNTIANAGLKSPVILSSSAILISCVEFPLIDFAIIFYILLSMLSISSFKECQGEPVEPGIS